MVMLISNFCEEKLTFPTHIQPKVDGVRCLINSRRHKGFSRSGKEIQNIQHILDELPPGVNWDGEIFADKTNFAEVAGMLRTKNLNQKRMKKLLFYVFDVKNSETFDKRLVIVQELKKLNLKYIIVADTFLSHNKNEMMKYHQSFVNKGYEGSVIRNANGLYINDRSEDCQKIKDKCDHEFRIVNWTTGDSSIDQIVWICETDDGNQFNVRPIGMDHQRREWLKNAKSFIGKMLTVQYKEIGIGGVPREPIGIGFKYEN